jgi:hypothetical protein
MQKQKNKNIYKLCFERENRLEKQMKWSNNYLEKMNKSGDCFKIMLNQGDVFEYKQNNNSEAKLCIVLDLFSSNQNLFLMCPIIIEKDDETIDGLNIGLIPEISLKYEFVAQIHQIKFINKRSLSFKENNHRPISLARVMDSTLLNIVSLYKSLISKITSLPKKYKRIYFC